MASIFGPDQGTKELYVVTAQVIPVLLLALALEARVFHRAAVGPPRPPFDPSTVLGTVRRLQRQIGDIGQRVEARAVRIAEADERIAAWERDLSDVEARARDLLDPQIDDHAQALRDLEDARRRLYEAQAEQVEYRRDVREWRLQVHTFRAEATYREHRLEALQRWWRFVRASEWGTSITQVGIGVAVLAIGEFESLLRISNEDYTARPIFAFAAIAYGFAAALIAAIIDQ